MDSHPFLHGVTLLVHSPFYYFLCNCSKSSEIFEKLEVKEATEFLLPSSLLLHYLMICTRYQLSAEGDFLSHHHLP